MKTAQAGRFTQKQVKNSGNTYHIFLSHKDEDLEVVKNFKQKVKRIYNLDAFADSIDWKNNKSYHNASRKIKALLIREVMRKSLCLIAMYSEHTQVSEAIKTLNVNYEPLSRWIPWEIGFMDGQGKKCAILCIKQDENIEVNFRKQEYLEIYPFVFKDNGKYLVIGKDIEESTPLKEWVLS